MYLNSLVDHLQHLRKVDPAVLTGSNESATGIVWTTLLYDTFSAIERKEEPLLYVGLSLFLPSFTNPPFPSDPSATTTDYFLESCRTCLLSQPSASPSRAMLGRF